MNPMRGVTTSVRAGSPLFTGLLYSLVTMAAATLVMSLFLKFTGMKEASMTTYVYIIHCISLLFGGLVTGKRAGKRGWYSGGMMGILYSIVIILIGFLSYDAAFTLYTFILLALSFAAGAFGGMIGVNLRR
ncbi:TIGR04086 family membrane protein [Paenibacillus thermotolerans]|uniref:TIGR04086 family membrane protein n=1 Tax=Paenibacillus thermotolerans TaxID=3027807 RepID=UPI002368350F|nr:MULTISPECIES: TIGR04086 family membrane protein [unclassified Paenibacillus]